MGDVLVTTPHAKPGLPIRTLRVSVLEGPDAGRSHLATEDKLAIGTAIDNDLMLEDASVSRYHVELSRGRHGVRIADCGSTNGTLVHGIHITTAEAPAGSVLQLGRTKLKVTDGEEVTVELHGDTSLAGVRGRSPVMRRLMSAVGRAALSDVSVLVVGESGTGKE